MKYIKDLIPVGLLSWDEEEIIIEKLNYIEQSVTSKGLQDIKKIQNALKKGNFCPSCGLFCCFLHSREEIETRM